MDVQKIDSRVRKGILFVGAAALVGITVYWFLGHNRDVSNPDVEFVAPTTKQVKPLSAENFVWPMYGLTASRTRALEADLKPPFKPVWRFVANQLLEFSPILVRGTLYVVRKDATVYAINAKTGQVRWRRKVGSLSAASPAYAAGKVFVVTLSGKIVALRASNGHVRWSRKLGARTESSPLIRGSSVIFGAENGKLYRLRQSNGRTEWVAQTDGAIKGGAAYADGRLFVGTYGGSVWAIRASSGRTIWKAGTSGARFGFSAGTFYATPSVAFGRVYVGNTDGKMYSFAASSGRLAWSRSTGDYVYSATAVQNVPKLGPTVFFGSYDGRFYALNARSGSVRWSWNSRGKISGAPTIVGGIVYFSTIDTTNTYGLSTRNGHLRFRNGSGAYNPVISDGRRIFMTGYESVSSYVPRKDFRRESRERRRAIRRQSDR